MRNILISAALASAVYAAYSTSAFAAQLVSDGNFTSPGIHPGVNTFLSGETFGPWAVIGTGCGHFGCAGVDVLGNDSFEAPPGGGNAVDLSGLAPGGVTQTLALTTGDRYTVSFYLSGNPDGPPNDKKMTVSIGNLDQTLHFHVGSSDNDKNLGYIFESFTFTGNGNDLLSFTDDGPINSPYGAIIGDVSVTSAIPEPATWAMFLVGFGTLGFLMHARRKQSNTMKFA